MRVVGNKKLMVIRGHSRAFMLNMKTCDFHVMTMNFHK